ncbi:MAG: hypothetical protein IMZ62_13885 [Chloroflexi bacterium]|nr:hypothetical protein [Chloroflexota bacterium]
MAVFEFSLGLTADMMDNLEDVGSEEIVPDWTYTESSNPVELANGHVRNLGFPLITWHWGFLSADDRTELRTFCPGKSADVFVRTPIDDCSYRTFAAVMVWPAGEDPSVGIYKDVTIEFRYAIEQEEESI